MTTLLLTDDELDLLQRCLDAAELANWWSPREQEAIQKLQSRITFHRRHPR